MESTFDIIDWSNRQEESLRALFATFDLNDDGLLDVGELRDLLSLIHQNMEDEENHAKLTPGQQTLLQGSIETITTFSMTSGVTFSEFVTFYNSIQEIGMQLRNVNTEAEETQADELIDNITEVAVKTSITLMNKPLIKRSPSEKDKFLALVEERRKLLHRQITKKETLHQDLVSNNSTTVSHSKDIDYITFAESADALRHAHNTHYNIDLEEEIVNALHAHFDDLEDEQVLSMEKVKFAKSLVEKRDMTAIFAFYKFAHNDVALRSYLDFKHAAVEKQIALHRNKKKREKYLLERAASYEAFLEERRNLLAATKSKSQPTKSEPPSPPPKSKSVAKKKKKKPRWALLYEDALRRITTVKAFEGKN